MDRTNVTTLVEETSTLRLENSEMVGVSALIRVHCAL